MDDKKIRSIRMHNGPQREAFWQYFCHTCFCRSPARLWLTSRKIPPGMSRLKLPCSRASWASGAFRGRALLTGLGAAALSVFNHSSTTQPTLARLSGEQWAACLAQYANIRSRSR